MFSYEDYLNGECTFEEYCGCFDQLIKPELGKTYIQNKGHWAEMHFKIIFSNEKVALGVCIYNKISEKFIGDHCLFDVNNGFIYHDTRPEYRLTEELI
jgi:hypothetical protein